MPAADNGDAARQLENEFPRTTECGKLLIEAPHDGLLHPDNRIIRNLTESGFVAAAGFGCLSK
jgi:hypothetical protein